MMDVIKWLDWNVRIRLIDEWNKMFPTKEVVKVVMTGEKLKSARLELKMTPQKMAKWLQVSLKEYKRWEKDGLRAPHDIEGPSAITVQMVVNVKKHIKVEEDILDMIGFNSNK